jgi:LysR family transcriptional regulator of abg operon
MKLHQLQYFVSVAEHGSIRAASLRLNVSPTAVSKSLLELERDVEASLFTRRSSGIDLTAAGKELLVHARLMLLQMERARQDLAKHRSAGGRLAIGVTAWVNYSLFPIAVDKFRSKYPEVQLDISEAVGTRHNGLRDGSLDVTLGLSPPDSIKHEFSIRPLLSYRTVVISRLNHPAAKSDSLKKLANCSWVMSRSVEELDAPFLLDLDREPLSNQSHTRIHYARSLANVLALVEGTDMLTLCPWPLLETSLMRGRFQAIPVRDELPEHVTSLLTRRNDPTSAAVQGFTECFEGVCAEAAYTKDAQLRRVMQMVESI